MRQHNIPNDFLIYLARYGFYRNVCTLSLLITVASAIYFAIHGQSIKVGILLPAGLLVHYFTYYAAKDFFILAGAEVYRNFLLWYHSAPGSNRKDKTVNDMEVSPLIENE